jgi:hypothetical protein
MNDSIPPVPRVPVERRVKERRSGERRGPDRRQAARGDGKNLPVPVGTAERIALEPRPQPGGGSAPFAAQLIGQDGQKRGLKGGPPVLRNARAAYLTAEWSGPNDRRGRAGRVTRTEI